MKKFLLKSLAFALILLTATIAVSSFFSFVAQKNRQEKIFWIQSKKDQNYKFAFLGSSRVLNMVDINYLESVWGGQGINLGTAGSGLADNYLTLYSLLKNGNKVDNLFLQIDEQSLNPSQGFGYPFHENWYFDTLGSKAGDETYLDQSGKTKYLTWKYLPPVRYIEFNNPYKELFLGLFSKKMDFDKSGGSELLEKKYIEKWNIRPKVWQVEDDGKKYFEKIISLARENNINLIIYTAPYPVERNYNDSYKEITSYIKNVASKNGLPYLDLRNTPLSKERLLFRNLEHLDKNGTLIFCQQLAQDAIKLIK
jgi:hypothetical protein